MKTPEYGFAGRDRRLTFEISTPEKKRVYLFPGGDKVELENVTKVAVSAHGNHMVFSGDTVTIVPPRWIALSYPLESSTPPNEVK